MTIPRMTLLACLMLASAFAFADCPDGGRDTTPSERADYVETTTALKTSLPVAPAGWRVLDRNFGTITAPNSTYKGSMLVPGYYVTYIWSEQEQRVRKADDEKEQTDRRATTAHSRRTKTGRRPWQTGANFGAPGHRCDSHQSG